MLSGNTKKGDNLIIKLAKKIATRDANTSCPFLSYQPKLPKEVKKLKKFKGGI